LLSRNTYLELNTKNIQNNVYKIINKYNNYKYYIGVVKADCYGHGDMKIIKSIIEGGCNYLAVATLDEAIEVRKEFNDIPILCLGHIPSEYIDICKNENIAITIHSLEYAKELLDRDCTGLKVHLKINTGMNRLGISDNKEVLEAFKLMKENDIELEGIYTHIYDASNEKRYLSQIKQFENDVASGKEVDINQYLVVENRDYNNGLTKLASKLSDGISNLVQSGVNNIFKFLSKIVDEKN